MRAPLVSQDGRHLSVTLTTVLLDEGGKGKKVNGFFNTGIPKLLFKKYDL
jgi:hypothetical protein